MPSAPSGPTRASVTPRPLALVVPRRRRGLVIALIGGGLGLAAGAVGIRRWRRDRDVRASAPVAPTAPVPTRGPTAPPPDAAPRLPPPRIQAPATPTPARIRVGGKPGRQIEIDGTAVGKSPLIVPVEPGIHTVRVDGGVPLKVEVTTGATLTVP